MGNVCGRYLHGYGISRLFGKGHGFIRILCDSALRCGDAIFLQNGSAGKFGQRAVFFFSGRSGNGHIQRVFFRLVPDKISQMAQSREGVQRGRQYGDSRFCQTGRIGGIARAFHKGQHGRRFHATAGGDLFNAFRHVDNGRIRDFMQQRVSQHHHAHGGIVHDGLKYAGINIRVVGNGGRSIQRVGRAGVAGQEFLQPGYGFRTEVGIFDAFHIPHVGTHAGFSAGKIDGSKTGALRQCRQCGEELGCRQQFFQIANTDDAEFFEHGVIHAIRSGERTGMRGGNPASFFAPSGLEDDHGFALQRGCAQCADEFFRLGGAFHIQAYDPGVFVIHKILKVIFHAHHGAVARRDGIGKTGGRAVHERKTELAALGNNTDGTGSVPFF